MEYVYSAMLLHSAGKPVTEEGITSILKAAGVEVNEARVKALVASLEGVNIDEAVQAAVPVAAAAAPASQAAPAGEEKKEEKKEKKEEKKEEKTSEEEVAAGLGALFG